MWSSGFFNSTAADGSIYAMSTERAIEYGFVSHYKHTGDPATEQLLNNITLSNEQLWWLLTNPFSLQVHLGGWGGLGFDAAALPKLLLPCLVWTITFLLLRIFCQQQLSRLGLYLQVVVVAPVRQGESKSKSDSNSVMATRLSAPQRSKLKKFQSQLWLAAFYITSTVYGYIVQRDKPWFGLPINKTNGINLLTPHPYNPGSELLLYYQYGLGFYLSELISLFIEKDMQRSDFTVYFIHHVVTIILIIVSHCCYDHRFGVYVLFIHDASDIMLAVSKAINYVVSAAEQRAKSKTQRGRIGNANDTAPASLLYRLIFNEIVVNICFVTFVVSFFFFRLVCLPLLAQATFLYALKIRMFTLSYWFVITLLQVALQGMHVYWFLLILRLLFRTICGHPVSDIRSDEDEEEDKAENDGVNDSEFRRNRKNDKLSKKK